MSIPDFTEKIKDWLVILFWPLFWANIGLIMAFLGLVGYELAAKKPVVITTVDRGVIAPNSQTGGSLGPLGGDKPIRGVLQDLNNKEVDLAGKELEEGVILASKNGTKYYTAGCSGAKRIKPENIVSFASAAAAESAGYTKAKNCK